MIQITPLRRRVRFTNRPSQISAQYGDHTYISNGYHFMIRRRINGAWYVRKYASMLITTDVVLEAGLYKTDFPRRKDAVAALEQFVSVLEDEG